MDDEYVQEEELIAMDEEQIEEEEDLGPLGSAIGSEDDSESAGSEGSDEQPQPSSSHEEPANNTYWLAQYFTRASSDVGLSVMAVKYPLHWPRDKVEKAAKEVQKGDKYAVKNLPVTVKQVTATRQPPPSLNTSDWRVTYRVFKSPTSMTCRRVELNYSNVFTEEEVSAEAHRAIANHPDAEPNSLMVERITDADERKDCPLDAMYRAEEIYPLLEDKDWLKKMTSSDDAPTARAATRKRAAPESTVTSGKRRSLRLYDKEKEKSDEQAEKETEQDLPPDDVDPEPKPSTSKKSSKPLTTPKERFKGKVFQHPCPDCGKAFRTKALLQTHRSQCMKCPTCGEWRDVRHAERCKNYQLCQVCDRWLAVDHKCRGQKLVKAKQLMCAYCQRPITEVYMYTHMKRIHGMQYVKGAYPECIPLDEIEAQNRLKSEMEEEKKELEVLRSEREEAAALKEAHEHEKKKAEAEAAALKEAHDHEKKKAEAEAAALKEAHDQEMKTAAAQRLKLEEENLSLKQEKLLLEGMKLNAEKAIIEKEEQLQKLKEKLMKAKEEGFRRRVRESESEARLHENPVQDTVVENPLQVTEEQEVKVEFEPVEDVFDPLSLEEREAMSDDTYWFPAPATFSESKKYKPTEGEVELVLSGVPGFVCDAVVSAMPDSVITGMPNLVLSYNQRGRLPNWIVIWFMRALRSFNNRASDETLFMKSLHIIEALREKLFYG